MYSELNKALEFYNKCIEILETIDSIRDKLKSAKNWGIFDIMGGGFIASIIKRTKMNNASSDIEFLQSQLRQLRSCFDTNTSFLRTDLELPTNSFDDIFDIVFDNIFTNVSVQSKIANTLKELDVIGSKITEMVNVLEDRYTFANED